MSSPDAYDQQPYTAFAWEFTHPGRLAAIARMRGVAAPALSHARILELGCASGTNLLPMAEQLPQATVVGVDRSAVQVAQGQALQRAVGVGNLTLLQGDLDDPTLLAHPALQEPFDYILSHGLYTWVSPQAQRTILQLSSRLSSGGVAYISADLLPGARLRQMSRDLLQCFDDPSAPVQRRLSVARRVLQAVGEAHPDTSAMGEQLRLDARRAVEVEPAFLLHDRLAEHYRPCLLSQLVRDAEAEGLQFLGDAIPTALDLSLPPTVDALLDARGASLVDRLQAVDLVREAAFRRVLFTSRDAAPVWPMPAAHLDGLHIRGKVTVEEVSGDEVTGVEVASLARITAAHPASVQLSELASTPDEADRVATVVRGAWMAGAVVLSTRASPVAAQLPNRPRTLRLTRYQAASKERRLVNALHGLVGVDALDRSLLKAMDGMRTRDDLLQVAVHDAILGDLSVRRDGELVHEPEQLRALLEGPVNEALEGLVRTGFVLAEGAHGG